MVGRKSTRKLWAHQSPFPSLLLMASCNPEKSYFTQRIPIADWWRTSGILEAKRFTCVTFTALCDPHSWPHTLSSCQNDVSMLCASTSTLKLRLPGMFPNFFTADFQNWLLVEDHQILCTQITNHHCWYTLGYNQKGQER